uniref:Uncharacterized protein n=1 Tax=Arundo donax TaxID=35708 RepID=A0A0A8YWI9_ARUDO
MMPWSHPMSNHGQMLENKRRKKPRCLNSGSRYDY